MILFFVFGTLPAVLMPIAIAVASILNTFTLVWILTYLTNVSIIVQFLIALVGLGVAIDYALLMIFRFRDELREGEDVETAIVETMTHAGRSVIVSGSTVAVGLLSMIILPLPFIRSIGIGGMLIPAVSVLAAITLLPALLAVLGTRINSLRVLPKRFVDQRPSRGRAVGPLGRARHAPAGAGGDRRARDRRRAALLRRCSSTRARRRRRTCPGTGDAIVGRDALAAPASAPGVMKPFVVLVEHGSDAARDRGEARRDAGHRRRVGADSSGARDGDALVEAFPTLGRREQARAHDDRPHRRRARRAPTRRSAASRRRTATSCTRSTATSRTCSGS